MGVVVKPNNKQLSEWYLLLSQQLEAGVTLAQAIQITGIISSENRYDLVQHLEEGMDTVEVFERFAPWMPPTDRKLIAAAYASGKLPEVLSNLSVRRNAIAENVGRAISACYYPLFVVLLAALVTPVFDLLDFSSTPGTLQFRKERYLPGVIQSLGITGALVTVVGLLLKQNNPRFLGIFPFIREYSRLQSIADFASLLSSFIKAGATFDVAWRETGEASPDSRLVNYSQRIADQACAGVSPGTLLNPKNSPLPPEFISMYISGEQTGQLDKNLDMLARLFQEKANLKLKQASEWYPIFVLLCAAVYVGFGVVKFYTQYLDILTSILRPGGK